MFVAQQAAPPPMLHHHNTTIIAAKMAHREISLFLKYPGPPVALQRLQHSFLECVIEYKMGSTNELQTVPPSQLRSAYQLKGTAMLVDDELVVQFVPKNAGLHSVRIFSDTREVCRPIAFIINQNSDVETTPYDKPVNVTSSLFKTPPQSQPSYQTAMPSPPQQYSPPEQYSPPSVSQRESSVMSQMQDRDSFWQNYPTDPTAAGFQAPVTHQTSPQHRVSGNMARQSYVSSTPLAGRPISVGPMDEAAYAGDLFTSKPENNTFSSLYAAKKRGQQVGTRKAFMEVDHTRVMTQDTFKMLEKDIDAVVTRGHKGKQSYRCAICSNKLKASKMIELGEEGFCERCFRRQYILRSAIEHFMVPSIQECTVEVPVNKRATKFVSSRKTMPNVNLRGLEPNEIKYAISEFRKFSPDDNGWITKAVLLPLMKACFSYNLGNQEIKSLLSSEALQSVMTSFGLDERDEVHEIEFLALVAFLARERQRLKSSSDPNNKFTGADLQMAYAFKNHFEGQKPAQASKNQVVASSVQPPVQTKLAYATPLRDQSARFRTSSAPPQGYISKVPLRNPNPQLLQQRQQQGENQMYPRDSSRSVYAQSGLSQASGNPPVAGQRGSGLLSPIAPQLPSGFRSMPPSQHDFSEIQQPQAQFPQFSPERSSLVFPQQGGLRQSEGGLLADLPEEDQDESEMPTLPPNKDPAGQTITNPLGNKRQANSKQMMEQLKLTGGSADSWMLY